MTEGETPRGPLQAGPAGRASGRAGGYLPERERVGANAGVEELDVEGMARDWPGLPNELVQPGFLNEPLSIGIHVDPVVSARRGTVVVRADGCKLEVLKRCSVKNGKYDYLGLTPKTDKVVMRDSVELYANVPVYAAKPEGKLQTSGALEVAMVIVGQWDSAQQVPSAAELEGECAGATHVVTALTVGSFEFSAGTSTEASASVSVAMTASEQGERITSAPAA